MAGLGDFTNQFISQTYHRVLQLFEGVIVDGTGSYTDIIISGNLQVNGNLIGSIQSASYVPLLAGPNISVNYTPLGIAISASSNGSSIYPSLQSESVLYALNGSYTGSNFIRIINDLLSITGSLYASSITGSLLGTASSAVTASYIPLIPGPNISINYTPAGIAISSSATSTGSNFQLNYMTSNSIAYAMGGNLTSSQNIKIFGDSLNITGSVYVSGVLEAGDNGRNLYRSDGSKIFDFQHGVFYSPSGTEVISTDGVSISSTDGITSINAEERQLIDAAGVNIFDYSINPTFNTNTTVSGNLYVSGNVEANNIFANHASIYNIGATNIAAVGFTGSLLGTASYALQSSFANASITAESASYVNDNTIVRGGGAGTPNYVPYWVSDTLIGNTQLLTDGIKFGLYAPSLDDIFIIDAITAGAPELGLTVSGTLKVYGNLTSDQALITGSLYGTSSWALNSLSASYADNSISASYALTASYVVGMTPSNGPKTDTIIFSLDGGDQALISGSTLYGVRYISGSWNVKNWTIASKTGKHIVLDVQGTTITNFTGSYNSLVTGSYPSITSTFATQSFCSWSIHNQIVSVKIMSNYGSCKDAYLFLQIEQ